MAEILFRVIMEVLGKPAEHVQSALQSYLKRLKEDSNFKILNEELAEVKKREDAELWSTFAELEIRTKNFANLIYFCFEYMPSVVEILEPETLTFKDVELTNFVNDLQTRLHQVDMVAKQFRLENDIQQKAIHDILKNYITLLLKNNNLTAEQLSKLTGLQQDKLADFLDILIDEGRVDLKEGIYFLCEPKVK